jgi:hypothetical protein
MSTDMEESGKIEPRTQSEQQRFVAESWGFEPRTQSEQQEFVAESGGFEPPVQVSPYNGLANRRLQPLGQLSSDMPMEAP